MEALDAAVGAAGGAADFGLPPIAALKAVEMDVEHGGIIVGEFGGQIQGAAAAVEAVGKGGGQGVG